MKTKFSIISVASDPNLINKGVAKTKLRSLFAILLLSTSMTWAFPFLEGGVCRSSTKTNLIVDWQNTYLPDGIELRMRFSLKGDGSKTSTSGNDNPMFLASSNKISPPTRLTYTRFPDGTFKLTEMKKDSHRCGGWGNTETWKLSWWQSNKWIFERQDARGNPTINYGSLTCNTNYGDIRGMTGHELLASALAYKKTVIIEWVMKDGGMAELSSHSRQEIKGGGIAVVNYYSLKVTRQDGVGSRTLRTYPAESSKIPDNAVDNLALWDKAIKTITVTTPGTSTATTTLTTSEAATELIEPTACASAATDQADDVITSTATATITDGKDPKQ